MNAYAWPWCMACGTNWLNDLVLTWIAHAGGTMLVGAGSPENKSTWGHQSDSWYKMHELPNNFLSKLRIAVNFGLKQGGGMSYVLPQIPTEAIRVLLLAAKKQKKQKLTGPVGIWFLLSFNGTTSWMLAGSRTFYSVPFGVSFNKWNVHDLKEKNEQPLWNQSEITYIAFSTQFPKC